MLSHCVCPLHLGGQMGVHHAWLVILFDKEGVNRTWVSMTLRSGVEGGSDPSLVLTCSGRSGVPSWA